MARGMTRKAQKRERNPYKNKDKGGEGPKSVFNKLYNKYYLKFAIIVKIICMIVLALCWSYLYFKKYIPYKEQNQLLSKALNHPELLKYTVRVAHDYSDEYNRDMERLGKTDRLKFFERINKENAPTDEEIALILKDDAKEEFFKNRVIEDDDEAPIAPVKEEKEVKKEVEPEEEEEDIGFTGDIKEEIMGGEIYTVDEIFKKLGIEKTTEYSTYSEYERNLLKEFRLEHEMPENIAKKADYYKPIIERGLKEDERFYVKKINDKKGYGLFARVDILPEDVIGVYTGVIQASNSEKGKKYEWYYSTIPDREKEEMVELRVNGKHEGSALRFVNHSLYYNTRLEYVPYNNQWYILFVSNRYINRGEEITVNYRETKKRMPSKIVDKWDKVEEEEVKKLYEEYMKLKEEAEKKDKSSKDGEKKVKEEL